MAPVRLWVEASPAGILIRKMLPLSDTLVLDLTQVIAGPTAGQILGDMGADVIKVEPLHGEHFRPHFGGAWVPSMNRNKRGLALDLRTAGGRDVLMRLVAQGRRLHGGLHAGRHRQAGLRLGDRVEGESAAGLCLDLGLRPDRPLLRAPATIPASRPRSG